MGAHRPGTEKNEEGLCVMATWNSRGLRGSTLEDLINRTNEQYREKGLALIQKVPTPITPIKIDKKTGISPWPILTRKVRWTISGRCRGFPYALTPRSATGIPSACRISMSTR